MIHYHGTPCGATREDVARFLKGRHALIPWIRPEDIGTAAEVCQSFCLDNGAFSAWKSGKPIDDWTGYYEWVDRWSRHPAFDWAIIPDVIDGSEEANDMLLADWPYRLPGVPVWHFHESLDRLRWMSEQYPRIALGSSGQFATVNTRSWWGRMREVMNTVCDDGLPRTKLHGLRMLNPKVFTRIPLASADSTNAVRNSSSKTRFGIYYPPNASTRMAIIAERIEAFQSSPMYCDKGGEATA